MTLSRAAVLGAAALVLSACGGGGDGPSAEPDDGFATVAPSDTADPDATAAPESDDDADTRPDDAAKPPPDTPAAEALRFTAQTVAGEQFDAADLAGRPTMFWFWAPWCTECAARAPDVRAAADAFGADVQIVGVAGLSSDVDSMATFVERHDLGDLTQLADADGSVYTRFGITQQDAFVLVATDGAVSTVDAYGTDIDLRELIETELL